MKKTEIKILQSAAVVLAKTGSAFSMRKVAEEASISLGNLQYYFKTKNDLMAGLLNFYSDAYKDRIDTFLEEHPRKDKETAAKALMLILEDLSSGDFDEMDQVILSLYNSDKNRRDILDKYYQGLYKQIVKVLESIVPNANITKINIAASIILPFMESYSIVHSTLGASHEEIVPAFTDMIWGLIQDED